MGFFEGPLSTQKEQHGITCLRVRIEIARRFSSESIFILDPGTDDENGKEGSRIKERVPLFSSQLTIFVKN